MPGTAGQLGDEMIFEGADSAFGGIVVVDTRWGELEVDVLLL